jgi:defect-in-organelle-trafficking protein DotA
MRRFFSSSKHLVQCLLHMLHYSPSLFIGTLMAALTLFSSTSWAADVFDNSTGISFTPPPGDSSITFLSNIFGTVDGVLVGTGSQILGQMFAVFNAAVISLGGIVIMYTLIVSTMNTAQEGQFLGQKWSSIWVPIRSVTGIGLLMPKASGYSMIQVFVMWVCVQGVGAADKIWSTALSYLNEGGVIVQAKVDLNLATPGTSGGTYAALFGAGTILEGQVCMLTLETALNALRDAALKQKDNQQGICYQPSSNITKYLCDNPFDFMSSVSISQFATSSVSKSTSHTLPMPNFSASLPSTYCDEPNKDTCPNPLSQVFNGTCGTLAWVDVPAISSPTNANQNDTSLSQARTLAIQQMYDTLLPSAILIASNLKFTLVPCTSSSPSPCYPTISITPQGQFGQINNQSMDATTGTGHYQWGSASNNTLPVIFAGNELANALQAYTNIMLPVLRLQAQSSSNATVYGEKKFAGQFLKEAEQDGWVMAGSYYMRLVLLSDVQASTGNSADLLAGDTSGMDSSIPFDQGPNNAQTNLLNMLKQSTSALPLPPSNYYLAQFACALDPKSCNQSLEPMANNIGVNPFNSQDSVTPPTLKDVLQAPLTALCQYSSETGEFGCPSGTTSYSNKVSFFDYSVLAWMANQQLMFQSTEPGTAMKKFQNLMNFPLNLQKGTFSNFGNPGCGSSSFFVGCIVSAFITVVMDFILDVIVPYIYQIIEQLVQQIISVVLDIPIKLVTNIFIAAVTAIQNSSTNPIVALANMGVLYINSVVQLWIYVMLINIISAVDPLTFPVLMTINLFLGPLLFTWFGIMVSIGFITAYYAPFLPFMIFIFGVLGWLMAVIEAMVAAPIVALGISSPEGDQALGKAEHAIMILTNVFLRPSMMIIGYIAAIILSYVGVWAMNAGFSNAEQFLLGNPQYELKKSCKEKTDAYAQLSQRQKIDQYVSNPPTTQAYYQNCIQHPDISVGTAQASGYDTGNRNTVGMVTLSMMMTGFTPENPSVYQNLISGYVGYAGLFGTLFCVIVYTWIYWTIVQESFNLISTLPDKVLRWVGGQQEAYGQEAARWTQQTQGEVKESGKAITSGMTNMAEGMGKYAQEKKKGSAEGKMS